MVSTASLESMLLLWRQHININPASLQTHLSYQDWLSIMTAELGRFWPPLVTRRHCSSWLSQIRRNSHQAGRTLTFFTPPNLYQLLHHLFLLPIFNGENISLAFNDSTIIIDFFSFLLFNSVCLWLASLYCIINLSFSCESFLMSQSIL